MELCRAFSLDILARLVVDPSAAILTAARALPHGDDPGIPWRRTSAKEARLDETTEKVERMRPA